MLGQKSDRMKCKKEKEGSPDWPVLVCVCVGGGGFPCISYITSNGIRFRVMTGQRIDH